MRQVQQRPTGPYNLDTIPNEDDPAQEGNVYTPDPWLYIGGALDKYFAAHAHRDPRSKRDFEASINQFLTVAKLHENSLLKEITKGQGRLWLDWLHQPQAAQACYHGQEARSHAALPEVLCRPGLA
jgi:hypothetical protein